MTKSRPARLLIPVLLGAIGLKAVLLAVDAVPFNADEAIVALMARHILQGERPWFFYGQAYMGSLDAYLVAVAFALLGESVPAVRVVQMALFAATLLTSYVVARRLTGCPLTALLTVLLLAFPPVLLTLYTTASLGGYGEALLVGNLLLWWGHRLIKEDRGRWALWAVWGAVAGVGFWATGLVLVYAIPVGIWVLWQLCAASRGETGSQLGFVTSRVGLLALGLGVGSLPWWLGNLDQVETGVAELFGTAIRGGATEGALGTVGARFLYFVVLGLPALSGLRFPWTVGGPPMWLGVPALALYLGALGYVARRARRERPDYVLLWGIWGTLFLGFVLTPFGGDPSGRYFLPLYVPLSIFTADALVALREHVGRWTWALLALVVAFNLVGTAQAARDNPPGITTQFDPISQVDHRAYGELMDFLRAQGETRGYTNYWIAYPLAFLSEEEIVLVPRLPYKADLRYTGRDDRYAPYGDMVEISPTAVYVTSNHPALDERLREQFSDLGVRFRERQISSYHIFYALSRKVKPAELSIRPGE